MSKILWLGMSGGRRCRVVDNGHGTGAKRVTVERCFEDAVGAESWRVVDQVGVFDAIGLQAWHDIVADAVLQMGKASR